jgi:hypothetical protein
MELIFSILLSLVCQEQQEQVELNKVPQGRLDCYFDQRNVYRCDDENDSGE